jgi:aryl-phospho-beta-D-glucosidase BglC (GH1 family)
MIDIHNFARWNGQVIGQGGPTDEQFTSFWGQLASKYANSNKVVFELMNEPHDLDIAIWAQTSQKAVTAIRKAGATSQMILLAGTNFDSAATLVSSGSADALLAIRNPDGSTDNLLLDIHKYLDEDNSGTHALCITDNVDAFTTVAKYLRSKGRKGLISETGASSDASVSLIRHQSVTRSSRITLATNTSTAVHGSILYPELIHQHELGCVHGFGCLGRWQLQHVLCDEYDTFETKRPARRQRAHEAMLPRSLEQLAQQQ